MTDFKAVARARGLDIPEADLDRIAATLEKLEALFGPLAADLPSLLEPVTGICSREEAE